MTEGERQLLCAFLLEMRRHLLGQAKACEQLLRALQGRPREEYNSGQGNATVTPPPEFEEER